MRQEFQKPRWIDDWKIFLIFAAVSFAFAFGLRCLDLPKWDNPAFSVNGEYILGTHDAYYWLAGAKGVGSAVDNSMSILVRTLGSITGAQYANIAFWLPAIFAGLTGVAALLWGMLVAGPWVGLVGAVYATAVPAYYFRTRLSYYDTDLVTLFFPILISAVLAGWLVQGVRTSWLPGKGGVDFEPTIFDYCLPILAGLLTLHGNTWHADVGMFGLLMVAMGSFLVLVCPETQKNRVTLLKGMILFAAAAFLGLFGIFVSIGLLYLFVSKSFNNVRIISKLPVLLVILGIVLAFSGAGTITMQILSAKIGTYLKPVAGGSVGTGPVYPGVTQSIIEAQNINFDALFNNIMGSKLLGWAGYIAFFVFLVMRPIALFVAPLAIAAGAAVVMGGRFGMFCGLPLGLGLAWIFSWFVNYFVEDHSKRKLGKVATALIIGFVLLGTNFKLYLNSGVTPIMYKQHAAGLIEAGKVMPEDSTVWTWWDWGYATMYYTERDSFANGGKHPGPILYPLALPYATPSYLQANQFIKYSALQDNNPSHAWESMSGKEVDSLIKSFGSRDYNFPVKKKQYLVVTWKDISLAYWILYYGSWNVSTGVGVHPATKVVYSAFSLDFDSGEVHFKDNGVESPLAGINILSSESATVRNYNNNIGPSLIFNEDIRQGFIMDNFASTSMMLKLFTVNPKNAEVARHFKLLYEGMPFVRIYEVI